MSEPIEERGEVTEVRVYLDRAVVTRRRRLELDPGLRAVRFGPLPTNLKLESFEAKAMLRGEAPKPVRIAAISAKVENRDVPDGRQPELKAQIEALRGQLNVLRDADQQQQRASELLGQYAEIASTTLSKEWLDQNPAFDKWGQAFDQLRQSRYLLAAERAGRRAQAEKLTAERQVLEAELARLGRPEVLGLFVTVQLEPDASDRGPLEVDLGYLTHQAQWTPAYDARFQVAGPEAKEHLQLTAIALVRQSTGEDWKDVTLVATTARPPLSEPPPQLRTLTVRGVAGGVDQQIVSTTRSEARLGGTAAAAEPEAPPPPATVEHLARGRVSVPATGRPVRVELFEGTLPARARLEIAPRERPVAIEVVELDNQTGRVLLPGQVSVFRGGNFSGQTEMPFVANKERFRIPLGTNATLRVKRSSKAEPEKKGLVTGALSWIYEIRTTIENLGPNPIEVLVRDRLPVSQLEEATVKILEIDKPTEVDADTGLTKLQLTIAPHSKREVGTSFKITAPRGFSLAPPPVV